MFKLKICFPRNHYTEVLQNFMFFIFLFTPWIPIGVRVLSLKQQTMTGRALAEECFWRLSDDLCIDENLCQSQKVCRYDLWTDIHETPRLGCHQRALSQLDSTLITPPPGFLSPSLPLWEVFLFTSLSLRYCSIFKVPSVNFWRSKPEACTHTLVIDL